MSELVLLGRSDCIVCEGYGNASDPLSHHECVPCPSCNYEGYCRYMGWRPSKEDLIKMGWDEFKDPILAAEDLG